MSILKTQQRLIQQSHKLPLYYKATLPPVATPQLFSFVRIGGQLAGEQSVINTQILSQLNHIEAANQSIY
ncbi:hypothetical protein L1D54_22440 [Vibrio brasiliensis]|uniref:hypothetical protein n=1 Tax=Vibrio brasiliensis TaxID=170652 RepID=UPI001EFD7F29|nr:hypothetical protein [Vibrio brasiliensis]MCG9753202.1 hypothetical protein [Vibrio brasiliensis]